MEFLGLLSMAVLVMAGLTAAFIGIHAVAASGMGGLLAGGFLMLIERSASLYELVLSVLLISTVLLSAGSLAGISNHAVLSLAILSLFSTLILVLFHTFKEPGVPAHN